MTPQTSDPLAIVGTTIAEKYLIERLVAEGGFSYVYRATHLAWKQPCVLKFLKGLDTAKPEAREQLVASLVREGALLRELSSRTASILQAHDLGTWENARGEPFPFLVLEWLDGEPLSDAIEAEKAAGRPPLTLREMIRLFDPVAGALTATHRRGIAHRDLKPDNFFVCGGLRSDDSYLKVLDFGVAKTLLELGAQPAQPAQTAQTGLSSQVAFTPFYGAPEQFSSNHGPTGPWTDVFAMALVLVELLTFDRPLSGDDVLALAVEAMHPAQRPTPRAKGVQVSDEIEAVFSRALSVKPAGRYRSMGEFWGELRKAAGLDFSELSTQGTLSSAAPSTRPPSTSGPITTPSSDHAGFAPASAAPASAAPAAPALAAPRWLWGMIGASTLIVVGGGALLLGMKMQSNKATTPAAQPLASASASASAPLPAPPAPACPEGMVKIPGGDFYAGYDGEGAMAFEKPQHPVKLAPFCVDVTEVTVERFRACSDTGRCQRAATTVSWPGITAIQKKVYGPLCNIDDPGRDRHPINCVTWEIADNYCKQQKKRLPTSAEWEFAVRGPDGRTYPWGDEPPDANRLNACGKECIEWGKKNGVFGELFPMHNEDDGFATTAPVGSFPKGRSRYGLDDVIGNVMEWVHDWDGPYDKAPLVDPQGPAEGTDRVIRGGAWNAGHMFWVRPSFRFKFPPETASHGVGFRCAAALDPG